MVLEKSGIYTFLKWDDVNAIKEAAVPEKTVVIIGAGLIGLKAAEALIKLGLKVKVVELANRVLSAILDEEAGSIVQQHLIDHGVEFYLNNSVKSFNGGDKVDGVTLNDGTNISCDFAIVAIGVVPNSDIAKNSGIETTRGIVTNERMMTNIDGIYAAGDVCESYDSLYNVKRPIPILPGAYKQGEIAGKNMAGSDSSYDGGFAMNSIAFFDLPMITAGIGKPESDDFETIISIDKPNQTYKKIVLKNNVVQGFIFLNKIDRAGIVTNLIKENVDVSSFKGDLISDDFGYAKLPQDYRKLKILNNKVV